MAKILIIEDDQNISQLIKNTLEKLGHIVFQGFYGMSGLKIAQQEALDLILLDIQLPDMDGFTLIKELPRFPVIYLTARGDLHDKVTGLNLGAEDYIAKPFAMDELIARVNVVLRRNNADGEAIRIGRLTISLSQRQVLLDGTRVSLTSQEFALLETLVLHIDIALSREQLLNQAWGVDYEGDSRTVDVHIQRIRKKLALEDQLKTIFKYGYRLERL